MAKEFKDIPELVAILESRGVKTDDRTPAILQREGYYAVVNGYKDFFLDRDAMQSRPHDVYKPGTTFANIYDLYLFDRELKNSVLPYLIEAEKVLKNAATYSFCKRHSGTSDYLNRSCYTRASDMLVPAGYAGNRDDDYENDLSYLLRRFRGILRVDDRTRESVAHYQKKYGAVPLWVVQDSLTFGNVQHFYQLQERGVQNETCRIVSEIAGHGIRIGARDLLKTFDVLVDFRNICAHGDRLYCAAPKGERLDSMFNHIHAVLPDDDLAEMLGRLGEVAGRFCARVDPSALDVALSPYDVRSQWGPQRQTRRPAFN